MKLWGALYAIIWVVFLEFLLAMTPLGQPILTYIHAGLGFVILGLAYYNFDGLRNTEAPGRVKRIAWTTLKLSLVMVFLGFLVLFDVGTGWPILFGVTVWNAIIFLHVVNAIAIITQAAATAIAHDMWEDKEFLRETRPGEVPPAPAPAHPMAARIR